MRCFACDCELSDYEATLKSSVTKQYLDMCSSCLREAQIIPSKHYQGELEEEEENE